MNREPADKASIPICNEVIFDGDGSVFNATCQ